MALILISLERNQLKNKREPTSIGNTYITGIEKITPGKDKKGMC